MIMQFNLGTQEVQVRTQTRTVTVTEFLHKGEVIARGEAWLNPIDEYDEEEGTRLSVKRAFDELVEFTDEVAKTNQWLAMKSLTDIVRGVGEVADKLKSRFFFVNAAKRAAELGAKLASQISYRWPVREGQNPYELY